MFLIDSASHLIDFVLSCSLKQSIHSWEKLERKNNGQMSVAFCNGLYPNSPLPSAWWPDLVCWRPLEEGNCSFDLALSGHCFLFSLQTIGGLHITDTFLKRTYDHEEVGQVFVYPEFEGQE